MNKVELGNAVAEAVGVQKNLAAQIVEEVFNTIADTVSSGETVRISKFGAFTKNQLHSRNGRNPKTGESIVIPESYRVGFKASKALKESVKEDI